MNDYETLYLIKPAFKAMSGRGSHTQVYSLDKKILGQILAEKAAEVGGTKDRCETAQRFGERVAERFLVKVGNIYEYVVKLSGGGETVIRRQLMSEAFGPVGYNLAPGRDKVLTDSRDAARQIPYLGFGRAEEQFAPDILGEIRRVIFGDPRRKESHKGLFLVEEVDGERRFFNVVGFLSEDPYFQGRVRNLNDLFSFQRYLREHPLDAGLRARLAEFFEAPMTVGVRDVLRFLEGSRHPDLGWETAEKVVAKCFEDHGKETFLPPEINYYTTSIHLSPEDVKVMRNANLDAAKAFVRWLVGRAPLTWTARMSDQELERLAYAILEAHHDYPVFEVEPYSGVFSVATARLLGRVLLNGVIHLTGLEVPERRNGLTESVSAHYSEIRRFLERLEPEDQANFISIVNDLLGEFALRGGIPESDGRLHVFRRVDKTFYSFQERAEYAVLSRGSLENLLTLEELLSHHGTQVIERYPDIPAKLLVFFVLAYRYFLDTGHVPDLRPDDAGRDLFVRGIWGYKTRNVLIAVGHDREGRPIVCVRFVDNKDQFKQYRRVEDRAQPLGLARYGLRLVHSIVQPAMERSIGIFADMASTRLGFAAGRNRDFIGRLSRWLSHLLHESVDAGVVYMQAWAHDLIDDTLSGAERVARKLLSK